MKKWTKKRKKYIFSVICASSLAILIVIGIFLIIAHILAPKVKYTISKDVLDYDRIEVSKPEMIQKYLTPNQNSRPGAELSEIKGIVVHYTANPGTGAMANRNYFESKKDQPDEKDNKVSSHYIIDLDGTIIQCIPDNEIAYASNDRNIDTLSIECCHPDKSGKFTRQTYDSLVHLISYLSDRYEINQRFIIRHFDVTGKNCPKYYVEHKDTWEKLKGDIIKYLKSCSKKVEE